MKHAHELLTWSLFIAAGSVGLGFGIRLAEASMRWKGAIEKRISALELRSNPAPALQAVKRTRKGR